MLDDITLIVNSLDPPIRALMIPLSLPATSVWLLRASIVALLAVLSLPVGAQEQEQEPLEPLEQQEPVSLGLSAEQATRPNFTLKPRWEFGVGGGFSSGFDYPASSETSNRGIALPFFIYRSSIFRAGDGGVRAVAIEKPRFTLELSTGGSLNANSDGNSAREGLPDLDFLFEIGPRFQLRIMDTVLPTGERIQGRFTADLRAVFATDFGSLESLGGVADIGVGFNMTNIRGSGITVLTGLDVTFASEKLQDYFYQVDPEFVTADRAFFDSRAGYLETTLFAGFAVQPFDSVRVFTGFIKGFFHGAANEDSPLFEVNEQTRFALAVVWTLATSDKLIEVVDLGGSN